MNWSWLTDSAFAIVLYRGAVTMFWVAVITIVLGAAVVFAIEAMETRVRAFRRWLRP